MKKQKVEYKHDNRSNKYYGNKSWRKLRDTYFDLNPLCEVCLAHGVINPAQHIHHKRPFLSGETDADKFELLLNYNNLMSVCSTCHSALHTKRDRYKMLAVSELTEKEYNRAHQVVDNL